MKPEQAPQILRARSEKEPFPKLLGIEVEEIGPGYARVAMDFRPDMTNIFGMLHGEVAVALQVTIFSLAPATAGARLLAEAKESNATRKTALYDCTVRQADGKLIASAQQAMAYRKGKPLPLTPEGDLVGPA